MNIEVELSSYMSGLYDAVSTKACCTLLRIHVQLESFVKFKSLNLHLDINDVNMNEQHSKNI